LLIPYARLEPDDVRKVYDGLLTSQRQGDPTMANVGEAPKSLSIGSEGRADVKSGDADRLVATLNGKVCRPRIRSRPT
jgi:hypothetical protein